MIDIKTSSTPLEDGARALKDALLSHIEKDVLLLFSGGSSLALIGHTHPRVLGGKCTISVLDERYTHDDEESNFSKVTHTTFFKQATDMGIPHIDPRPRENETLEEAGKRFDLALKEWHITHQDGVVVTTIGIGTDGHTAGILPMPHNTDMFQKLFLKDGVCAVGYEALPEMNVYTKRITTTLTYFTRHIDHAIIYATGAQKKDALKTMIEKGDEYSQTPAKILQRVKNATLFTDVSLY